MFALSAAAPAHLNRVAADAVFDSPGYKKWIESAKPGAIYNYDGGAIMFKEEERVAGNGTLEARRDCFRRRQLQTNVDDTDLWWDAWGPIVDCQTCVGGPCSPAWNWEWTTTWRHRGSWDDDGWDAVQSTINGNSDQNKGFKWAKSAHTSGQKECPAAAGQQARVWRQNRFGWADIAQRWVNLNNCPGQNEEFTDWQFSHLDLALEGDSGTYQLGCSYDERAECSRGV